MSSSTWATELSRHAAEPRTVAELYEQEGSLPEGWLCAFPRDGEIFVVERLAKVTFGSGFVGYEISGLDPLRYWGVAGTISGEVSVWRRPADSRISVSDWNAFPPYATFLNVQYVKIQKNGAAWESNSYRIVYDDYPDYPKAAPDER